MVCVLINYNIIVYHLFKGARYGNIDVNRVLRGADVTAEHVSKLANEHRCRITKELVEPMENDAVTFCPDMWSDPVRQISYLGISVAFVDDQYQYRSYDLCCSPFEEEDKSSESIITVSSFSLYIKIIRIY